MSCHQPNIIIYTKAFDSVVIVLTNHTNREAQEMTNGSQKVIEFLRVRKCLLVFSSLFILINAGAVNQEKISHPEEEKS